MNANIAGRVDEQARLQPASPAILTHEQIITYGQLRVAVGVVARHLRQNGVAPGQVAGVSMGQNALHLITLLALAQVGAVSLPLHQAVPAERRALAARRFGATCVVSGRPEMALAGLAFVSLAGLSFDGQTVPPDHDICPVDGDAPFRIALSSGTSGDPKGMVLTHGLAASRITRLEAGFTPLSRMLPLDLNFITGFGMAIRTLANGACLVLPRSMNLDHLLHAIVSHGVTHVALSPAQARDLIEPFATEGIHCPGLAYLSVAGGPLAPELRHRIASMLTPHVYSGYGSTESGMVAKAGPEILERHPGSVGRVHPWVRVEVVDAEDHPLPAGETGVLRIRSQDQVSGYFHDDARTRRHFRDGWFYPGDLGRLDEEGLLYIEGRADDQLNVGGLKVNPEDIDATLAAHPDVVEAGAFVLAGDEGQEQLAAAVVPRDADRLGDIQAHALARLGPLAPARYFVVTSLPRTLTGKLRRAELSAQFSTPARLPTAL